MDDIRSKSIPAGQMAQPVGEVLEYPSPYGHILPPGLGIGADPPLTDSSNA